MICSFGVGGLTFRGLFPQFVVHVWFACGISAHSFAIFATLSTLLSTCRCCSVTPNREEQVGGRIVNLRQPKLHPSSAYAFARLPQPYSPPPPPPPTATPSGVGGKCLEGFSSLAGLDLNRFLRVLQRLPSDEAKQYAHTDTPRRTIPYFDCPSARRIPIDREKPPRPTSTQDTRAT